MHGDAIRFLVESSEQSYDVILSLLPQDMKRPGAVLAAAPGEQNALHRDWSAFGIRSSNKLTPETDFFVCFLLTCSKSSLMIRTPSAMRSWTGEITTGIHGKHAAVANRPQRMPFSGKLELPQL